MMNLSAYMRGLGIGMVVTAIVMGGHGQEKLTDAQIRERARALGMVEEKDTVLSEVKGEAQGALSPKTDVVKELMSAGAGETLGDYVSQDSTPKAETDFALSEDKNLSAAAEKESSSASEKPEEKKSSSSEKESSASEEKISSSAKKESSSAAEKPEEKKTSTSEKVEEKKPATSAKPEEKKSTSSEKAEEKKTSTSEKKAEEKKSSSAKKEEEKSSTKKEETASRDGYISVVINSGETSTAVANKLKEAGVITDAAAFDRFLCENGYDRKINTGHKQIPRGASNVEIAGIITVR